MTQFLLANWLWILLIGLFVTMHLRGKGCGSHQHGGHGQSNNESSTDNARDGAAGVHQHELGPTSRRP